MLILFSVLIFLAAVLLIGVVLVQKSKGGGLAASASGYNQFMGVRKTTDFIEKATWGLAIFICVLSIGCSFLRSYQAKADSETANKVINLKEQKDDKATPFEAGQKPAAAPSAAPATPSKK